MSLSPSQSAVLACLKKGGIRYLPDYINGDILKLNNDMIIQLQTLGCYWQWSWALNQEAFTADYRRRITDLRDKGYWIVSFHVGNRHGYALITEPAKESEAA